MAAASLDIMLMFKVGKGGQAGALCDNPHLSGQQLHRNPHHTSVCPTHQISITQPYLA